jgi:hypothetical protein
MWAIMTSLLSAFQVDASSADCSWLGVLLCPDRARIILLRSIGPSGTPYRQNFISHSEAFPLWARRTRSSDSLLRVLCLQVPGRHVGAAGRGRDQSIACGDLQADGRMERRIYAMAGAELGYV